MVSDGAAVVVRPGPTAMARNGVPRRRSPTGSVAAGRWCLPIPPRLAARPARPGKRRPAVTASAVAYCCSLAISPMTSPTAIDPAVKAVIADLSRTSRTGLAFAGGDAGREHLGLLGGQLGAHQSQFLGQDRAGLGWTKGVIRADGRQGHYAPGGSRGHAALRADRWCRAQFVATSCLAVRLAQGRHKVALPVILQSVVGEDRCGRPRAEVAGS